MPIGTLMRKIQCQLATSMSQPPRMGPKIGPSSIGTPRIAISRPIRAGPAARVMIVMPSGMSMPAAEALQDAEADEELDRPGRGTQGRAGGEERDGEDVEPLRAEPVGGPAGERDDRGEREGVGRHRPRDGGVGQWLLGALGEDGLEGRQRDVDDGDVEDRHDRPEHDDTGDLEDRPVDLVGIAGLAGGTGSRHDDSGGRGVRDGIGAVGAGLPAHCPFSRRPPTAGQGSYAAGRAVRASALLARLLPLDDLGARDLVVQGLALVVPQWPESVEQGQEAGRTARPGGRVDA